MTCTVTSGTSMISRVRPSSDRGMKGLIHGPNGSGTRARISDAGFQDVAPAAHSVQKAWLAWVGFDLAAQAHDLHVEGALAGIVHAERLGDVLAREDLVGLAGKRGQQRRLAAGQADRT